VVVVIFAWQAAKDIIVVSPLLVPSTMSLVVGALAVVIFAWQANNGITILIVADHVIIDLPVVELLPSLSSMAS
jgi:hypothetical protein